MYFLLSTTLSCENGVLLENQLFVLILKLFKAVCLKNVTHEIFWHTMGSFQNMTPVGMTIKEICNWIVF